MREVAVHAEKPARPLSILLAEDSPSVREMVVLALRILGYQVTAVNSGRKVVETFEQAGRRGADAPFDVVLMDLSMPEMDGLTATRLIRQKEKASGHRVRIVALTAFTALEYRARCREAGMDAFVVKPININELSRAMMPSSTARPDAGPGAASPFTSPGDSDTPAGSTAARELAVDLREALGVVGGDIDLLSAAVAAALTEIPQQVDELNAAAARHDAQTVAAKAHRLKGIMAHLGGTHAREQARRIEAMDEHDLWIGGPAGLKALADEIERVLIFYADPAWRRAARAWLEGRDG